MSGAGFGDSIRRETEEEIERNANRALIAGIACIFFGWLGGPVSFFLGMKALAGLANARHLYPDLSVDPGVRSKAIFGIVVGPMMFVLYWVIGILSYLRVI